jgi:hypothetical protein
MNHNRIFYNCPGAWYGNLPRPDDGITTGVITVKIEAAMYAIDYLRKRYHVTGTSAPTYGITSPAGIMIHFEMKRQGA